MRKLKEHPMNDKAIEASAKAFVAQSGYSPDSPEYEARVKQAEEDIRNCRILCLNPTRPSSMFIVEGTLHEDKASEFCQPHQRARQRMSEKTIGGLQYEVENIIKDLAWARISKNGAPYIDNVPQAAQAAISHIGRYYSDESLRARIAELEEALEKIAIDIITESNGMTHEAEYHSYKDQVEIYKDAAKQALKKER